MPQSMGVKHENRQSSSAEQTRDHSEYGEAQTNAATAAVSSVR
jgi:hypothetical protein